MENHESRRFKIIPISSIGAVHGASLRYGCAMKIGKVNDFKAKTIDLEQHSFGLIFGPWIGQCNMLAYKLHYFTYEQPMIGNV